MSLPFKELYEFGEFRLDPEEKILTRDGKPVEVAPKVFELLTVLVENHGRLLEKDKLMDKIWADSFVEEGNLTFSIRQLRIALGDDAHEPKYIKTVRSHGYRFIADVRQITEETKPRIRQTAAPLEQRNAPQIKKPRSGAFLVSVIFLVVALGAGAWYALHVFRQRASVLTAPFDVEKLSANGKVNFAALSPDGKNLVYTNRAANETEAIWLRRLETGDNVELIAPVEANHYDLEFSPDGTTLYYSFVPWQASESSGIYRVSIRGGAEQKIAGDIFGRVGISPDGARVTYNRCPRREDEYCSLWIADADGANERRLVTRASGLYVGDSDFSPDGKRVAFTVGQARNKANEFGVWTIDLETGAEREFTPEKFYVITSVAWLPDAGGLLLSAFKFPDNNFRLWQIAADGAATALTNVSEHYEFLSIDKDARRLAAIQVKENFQLRLVSLDNPADVRFLADGGSAAFAPDGKIYFSSTMSGNHEIWSISADGTSRRQLTNSKDEEYYPVVAPDGNAVYFASTRSGAAQVWRMKPDGTEQTQITHEAGGFPLSVTKIGEWLYYLHGVDRTLWRVSLSTGEEQLVLNRQNWLGFGSVQNWSGFGVSPDGSLAAYPDKQGDENILAVAQIPGGQTLKTFHLPDKKSVLQQIGWTPDGSSLLYLSTDQKFENVILWKQPLDETTPRQIVALGKNAVSGYNLPVSPDGKTLAAVQQEILSDVVLLKGLK
ncbi:MAG TPA: winged helix-turn-helix domain-containing protein [Pyrinomonadaceae bacterium]|jgi:Tol biopolymer transport system component/DNA-binding winged helix-turn-helix (wHTH) protein